MMNVIWELYIEYVLCIRYELQLKSCHFFAHIRHFKYQGLRAFFIFT
jgi:hypothetical protein